jgi:hypothetical protein
VERNRKAGQNPPRGVASTEEEEKGRHLGAETCSNRCLIRVFCDHVYCALFRVFCWLKYGTIRSVYCAVRAESLNTIHAIFRL